MAPADSTCAAVRHGATRRMGRRDADQQWKCRCLLTSPLPFHEPASQRPRSVLPPASGPDVHRPPSSVPAPSVRVVSAYPSGAPPTATVRWMRFHFFHGRITQTWMNRPLIRYNPFMPPSLRGSRQEAGGLARTTLREVPVPQIGLGLSGCGPPAGRRAASAPRCGGYDPPDDPPLSASAPVPASGSGSAFSKSAGATRSCSGVSASCRRCNSSSSR